MTTTGHRRLTPLDRLAPPRAGDAPASIDWHTPIDRTRRFVCDTIAPLTYTTVYRSLSPDHRLRYNQLTGMFANELILRLETGFLDGVLQAVERGRRPGVDADLICALRRFRDDEHDHAEQWRRLNRLSAPEWYDGVDHRFVQAPPAADALARLLARHPFAWPVVFWIQLAQEERSIDISRRSLRLSSLEIEPRYAAVYRAHLQDEIRHVRMDCHLVERFYASRPMAIRRATAVLFRWAVAGTFLTPGRSTVRIVSTLASEYPELQPLVPRMTRELGELARNREYQDMMYSRRSTPIAFELFDAFPEFHAMRRVLLGYAPPAMRGGIA